MNSVNTSQIRNALQLAAKVRAKAVMIFADPLEDLQYKGRVPKSVNLYLISRKKKWEFDPDDTTSLGVHAKAFLQLPKINITRVSIIKVATSLALSSNYINNGDVVVFLVGTPELGILDSLQILDTGKETELVASKGIGDLAEGIHSEVFQAVLNLSIELAEKGREGKPIGTIFVVGDHENVLQFSKQMIINPFKGYDEEDRNILSGSLKETLREFASMDGAFVVSGDGVVITAGRYLGAATNDANLPRGLGSRHIAAAGITALTKSIAFVISESSGDLRIFKDGKILMTIEKSPAKK